MTINWKGTAWFKVLFFVVCVSFLGCDEAGTAAIEGVVDDWREAGLEVESLNPLKDHEMGDATCKQGSVGGVETVLCAYPSEAAANAAKSAGLAQVGDATGASLSQDKLLLVVADKKKADPRGKTINTMTRAFLAQ